MSTHSTVIEHRLKQLEEHLARENPVLLDAVKSFRLLDNLSHRIGLLQKDESLATQIPWWPLIAVLGTFSAGKSTFINDFLGFKLQRSGNQAVDDKFTVVCFAKEETPHALPGVALDSDPRFPFYKISAEIDKVAQGEGSRIDAYLQLKTCPSSTLKGKILIDSPGFDADAQRTSTLRITDHIIDLSDLVLVFFDARHPEPGAMRDTLDHLVSSTLNRPDSGKFLYVLNQLDTAAREDNPEEVVAAWQRALGERGLTAGRFYTIYNREAAVPIDDEALRRRFEGKRDTDIGEIHERMQQIEVERAYRIIGALEKTARDLQEHAEPALKRVLEKWRRRVLLADGVVFALLLVVFGFVASNLGLWGTTDADTGWWQWLQDSPRLLYGAAAMAIIVALVIHFSIRKFIARGLVNWADRQGEELGLRGSLGRAFLRNTRPWRSLFSRKPTGTGKRMQRRLTLLLENTDDFVQRLNDRFTNPSGSVGSTATAVQESPTAASKGSDLPDTTTDADAHRD